MEGEASGNVGIQYERVEKVDEKNKMVKKKEEMTMTSTKQRQNKKQKSSPVAATLTNALCSDFRPLLSAPLPPTHTALSYSPRP